MPDHVPPPFLLASSSPVRARLLSNAGIAFQALPAAIDEDAVRQSHQLNGGSARDLADILAEMKSAKLSHKHPGALVIGADQVLECDDRLFAKPDSREVAAEHLSFLSGRSHRLYSAAVVCQDGRPLWRNVGRVTLTMHRLSPAFIANYIDRSWQDISGSVGCYLIEGEGPRLFSHIDGDFFHILGLPLIELLTWLHIRGDITT